MNQALAVLRNQFKGQTATLKETQFDNSPIPDADYTARVVDSKLKETERSGRKIPVHAIRLVIETGEYKGRNQWPFAPDLSTLEGLMQSAKNIRAIKGDVVPGQVDAENQFNVKVDAFLDEFDALALSCVGELVEIRVKSSQQKKDDGTFWQNIYIQRGLGEDAKAHTSGAQRAPVKTTRTAPTFSKRPAKKTVRR